MTSAWTLPLIRMELEMLPPNCDFLLGAEEAARLFGADEDAAARMEFFASGHGCAVTPGRDSVSFRKRADLEISAPNGVVEPVDCFPPCGPAPRSDSDDHPGLGSR